MCRIHAYRTLVAICVALALALPASAQTWLGFGDSHWTSADNWTGFVAPVSGNNTSLGFGSTITPGMINDFAGTFVVNSLSFGAGRRPTLSTATPSDFR